MRSSRVRFVTSRHFECLAGWARLGWGFGSRKYWLIGRKAAREVVVGRDAETDFLSVKAALTACTIINPELSSETTNDPSWALTRHKDLVYDHGNRHQEVLLRSVQLNIASPRSPKSRFRSVSP